MAEEARTRGFASPALAGFAFDDGKNVARAEFVSILGCTYVRGGLRETNGMSALGWNECLSLARTSRESLYEGRFYHLTIRHRLSEACPCPPLLSIESFQKGAQIVAESFARIPAFLYQNGWQAKGMNALCHQAEAVC